MERMRSPHRLALLGLTTIALFGLTGCPDAPSTPSAETPPAQTSSAPATDGVETQSPPETGASESAAPPASGADVPDNAIADTNDTDTDDTDANVAVFESEEFTVTITGVGSAAAYRGCNAQQDCLDIAQASSYTQGRYTWENGDYTYVMTPADGTTGSYQLQVFDPDNDVLVDERLNLVGQNDRSRRAQEALTTLYAQADALGVCDEDLQLDVSQEMSVAYAVNDTDVIVEVLCFLAAYQGVYEYWFYQPESTPSLTRLEFDSYTLDGDGVRSPERMGEMAGLPTYDPATERLSLYTKYRGLGDCGAYSEYEWEGDRFALTLYREKVECDGNFVDPAVYPQVYP